MGTNVALCTNARCVCHYGRGSCIRYRSRSPQCVQLGKKCNAYIAGCRLAQLTKGDKVMTEVDILQQILGDMQALFTNSTQQLGGLMIILIGIQVMIVLLTVTNYD